MDGKEEQRVLKRTRGESYFAFHFLYFIFTLDVRFYDNIIRMVNIRKYNQSF